MKKLVILAIIFLFAIGAVLWAHNPSGGLFVYRDHESGTYAIDIVLPGGFVPPTKICKRLDPCVYDYIHYFFEGARKR